MLTHAGEEPRECVHKKMELTAPVLLSYYVNGKVVKCAHTYGNAHHYIPGFAYRGKDNKLTFTI